MSTDFSTIPIKDIACPTICDVPTLLALYARLFPVLIDTPKTGQDYFAAETLFFQTLYDWCEMNRTGLATSIDSYIERGKTPNDFVDEFGFEVPSSSRPFTREAALQFLADSLQYPLVPTISATSAELLPLLQPYLDYLERTTWQAEAVGQRQLLWKVLTIGYLPVKEVFWQWLQTLDTKGLFPYSVYEEYKISIDLHTKSEAQVPLTETEYRQCYEYITSRKLVLAAVAAKRIADAYPDEEDYTAPDWRPSLPDMLTTMAAHQKAGHVVVGAFVDGLCDYEGLRALENRFDLQAVQFDMREWVIETVVTSPEVEPFIHPAQALWFFVHEYLDRDPVAIKRLIDGKRYWVAYMCAEESLAYTYEVMKPVLQRLVDEATPDIAKAATLALARYADTSGVGM
ncbi:MAG: hypothetical protein RLZZ70_423 [Candidatus Parcubacteria bacterium]|jgi:hypothetical protein